MSNSHNSKSPSRTGTKKTEQESGKSMKMKSPSGTGTMKTNSSLNGLWEGIEVPTGVKRDRMVHIDAALQRIRRLDRGDMTLPSAKSLGEQLGVDEKTIRRLIQEMQDLYGLPIEYDFTRHGYCDS